MSPSELSPSLVAALDRKALVDARLQRLQQDMRAGIQVYSASAMLSALEDCDDATGAIWLELGQAVCKSVVTEMQENSLPSPITEDAPGRTYTMISATQLLVRQFFVKRPKASPASQPRTDQKQKAA